MTRWRTVPLTSICAVKNGKSDTQDAVEDGAYHFFDRSKSVKRSNRFVFDCEALIIPGEGTEFIPRHFSGKFDLHQRAYALHAFEHTVDVRFLFYYLHYRKDYFPNVAVGTTVKSLRMRHFEELAVRITERPEQERIVTILDQAFQGIAVAERLTRETLDKVVSSFEIHRDSLFEDRCKNSKTLGEVATFRNGVNFTTASRGKDVTIVGVKDFKDRFAVPTSGLDTVTINGEINADDLLKSGDLLSVRSNGNIQLIGRTMVTKHPPEQTIHSGFAIRTRLDTGTALPQYVCHFMRSRKTRNEMIAGGNGTNIKSLNQGTLAKLSLPLPDLNEQAAIASNLNKFAEATEYLKAIYGKKLAALEALRSCLKTMR